MASSTAKNSRCTISLAQAQVPALEPEMVVVVVAEVALPAPVPEGDRSAPKKAQPAWREWRRRRLP